MKKILFILSSIFLLQGCTNTKEQNPKLLGDWSRGYRENAIQFRKDSIVIREFGLTYFGAWFSDSTAIHIGPLIETNMLYEMSKNIDYKLNDGADTLYVKRKDESSFNLKLYRVTNAYDNILQRNEMQLSLPVAKDLERINKEHIAINLLLGYHQDTIAFKFQDGKFFNLNTLKRLTLDEFERINHEGSADNVQFNLIADKNLREATIDSITQQLQTIGWKNVFRVYANDQTHYDQTPWLSSITWYGIYE